MDKYLFNLYHTNDMHARLEAMSRLSHYVKRLRAEDDVRGILTGFWDAGDAADRMVEICSLTRGAAFSNLLNQMGVQLQTVGNDLSLTYGPQVLEASAA
ncbi:MAG: hypothetical protein R3335_14815, partial [Anaerolineales bacterium]|nr:hypothetical protein [Anaerolineales bacterium]